MIVRGEVSQADQGQQEWKDLPLPRHLVFYGAAAAPVGLSRNKVSPADPLPIVILVYLCAILLLTWDQKPVPSCLQVIDSLVAAVGLEPTTYGL
jgi:hypothetical protein